MTRKTRRTLSQSFGSAGNQGRVRRIAKLLLYSVRSTQRRSNASPQDRNRFHNRELDRRRRDKACAWTLVARVIMNLMKQLPNKSFSQKHFHPRSIAPTPQQDNSMKIDPSAVQVARRHFLNELRHWTWESCIGKLTCWWNDSSCLCRRRGDFQSTGIQSIGIQATAFSGQSESRHSFVHGRSALAISIFSTTNRFGETGGKAVARVGDYGATLRFHSA